MAKTVYIMKQKPFRETNSNLLGDQELAIRIGIQSTPGDVFSINIDQENTDPSEITIGATGIYELDLEGITKIIKVICATKNNTEIDSYLDYVVEVNTGGNE